MTQRLAKVFAVFWNPHLASNIKNAAQAPEGIDRHAEQSVRCFYGFELKRVVKQLNDIIDVAENIANATPYGFRRHFTVSGSHRLHHRTVEPLVKGKNSAIETLQGISGRALANDS